VRTHITEHFLVEEFMCPCCGEVEIDHEFIQKLEKARQEADIPFVITSGYRCTAHNQAVGGKRNSAHRKGRAADIRATTDHQRALIAFSAANAGFKRIGFGSNFIHLDSDPTLPTPRIWLY
jgi:uncharacterized protein YcbK (DUF882 family)